MYKETSYIVVSYSSVYAVFLLYLSRAFGGAVPDISAKGSMISVAAASAPAASTTA